MKTIFITRDLSPTSAFRTQLEAAGFAVYGKSLLHFSVVPFDSIPESDWLFFYSKNGVKYFFERLKILNIPIPKNVHWAAIGKGTADLLESITQQVDFVGTGDILQIATAFLNLAKNQSVLFVQATDSRQSIQSLLKNNIIAKSLIVYKNEPKEQINIPHCGTLVFTSPMNVKAYFKNRILLNHQKIFAIGRTTAKTLDSLGFEDYHVAEEPSEEALVKVILEFS
jgi:uroporphyrinogen-III synthase